MTSFDDKAGLAETACPKRLWVLWSLSDDEYAPEGELPRGLTFHLSRCPECRALAERLMHTAARLNELGQPDALASLIDSAHQQALAALHAGAKVTGRVVIDDDWEASPEPPGRSARWFALTRFAAAAVIILTAGVLAYLQRAPAPGGDTLRSLSASKRTPDAVLPGNRPPAAVPDASERLTVTAASKTPPVAPKLPPEQTSGPDDLSEVLEHNSAWIAHRHWAFRALPPPRTATDPNLDRNPPTVLTNKP